MREKHSLAFLYAHTYSLLLGVRRYVRTYLCINSYQGDIQAEHLEWTMKPSTYVHTCSFLLLNITTERRIRKHTACQSTYMYVVWEANTMGDKTLTLVFSNTCYTCPLMSAFLQGNEYFHTCYCSHCRNQ